MFPEGTLSGHNRNKMIEVPDPLLRVNLCSENETYHEVSDRLQNKIVINFLTWANHSKNSKQQTSAFCGYLFKKIFQ